LTVSLYDQSGKPIQVFFDGKPSFPGKASMSFSTKSLPPGQYVVQVKMDDQLIVTKEIVKM